LIGIVDYGLGNVQAIQNVYRRLGIPAVLASTPAALMDCSKLVLPGVGAFDWAMTRLAESGLRDALDEMVTGRGTPVLGICVGMQMLARRSDEGVLEGLGWIPGEVRRLDSREDAVPMALPHMGWNDVSPSSDSALLSGLDGGARFYFLHSYYFDFETEAHALAQTDYHGSFASVVGAGNVFGVQFHPEKSHNWGVQLLRNFAEAV